jgi:membrane protein
MPTNLSRSHGGSDGPTDLGRSGWKATLKQTQKHMVRDRVTMAAGSLAYHWFLALFPAVIAALGLLSLLKVGASTEHHLTDGIAKSLPPGTAGVFDAAVRAATRKASGSLVAVIIGIAIALWSASSGMAVLEQALDVAYEVPEDRKYVSRRAHAFPLMAITALLGGLAAALIVFGKPIGNSIESVMPFGGTPFTVAWTIVRWVLALAVVSVLFSGLYYFGANRDRPHWRWVSPGGLVATAVFLVASLGFSFYVSAFGSYGKTYGSFAGVAILIFWLWLTGLAVLIGGELNAQVEREAAARGHGAGTTVPAAGAEAGSGAGELEPAGQRVARASAG